MTEMRPETIHAALERVLAGETFRGAERSRGLLRFIVNEAVHGRADRLKDYVLGSEALGRGETFDPRTDPVARVEASRLRSRLDVYYANEGANDPIRISLPKGGYAPAFEARQPEMQSRPRPVKAGVWARQLYLGVTVLGVAAIATASGWCPRRGTSSSVYETHLDLVTPPTTDSISFALSPDGRRVVYVVSTESRARLWVRPLESSEAQPLAGTEDAVLPFWGPDGRSIGYFADSRIKRVDLDTGLVQTVSTAVVPAGAAWNRDGVLLHPIVPDSPLFRTSVDGAPLLPATQFVDGQTGHRGPAFLPDGRHFLFHASGAPNVSGIYVGELGTTAIRHLTDADAPAVVAPPDHILYVRDSALFIQGIEPDSVTLVGRAVRLAGGISVDPRSGVAAISASADRIIYRTGSPAGKRQLMWRDRIGREQLRIGSPDLNGTSGVALSRDGKRLAVERTVAGNTDIQIVDATRGTSTRFTDHPLPDIAPLWSGTNDRIVYSALKNGAFQLFQKSLGADPEALLETLEMKQATDWSSDDRYLLFRTVAFMPALNIDIWALPLERGGSPFPVVRTRFDERDGQFSPDGRFIAYQSNSSGRCEVYVRAFQEAGEPDRISEDGGVQVRWRADGRALYYINLSGMLVEVPIVRDTDGRSLKPGRAETLFRADIGALQTISLPGYQPARDGKSFLMNVVLEETPAPIRVISNWNGRVP